MMSLNGLNEHGGSSLRFDIFNVLVQSRKPMTVSQIARKMKIPRQNVSYHMPFLIDSGLVIQDGTSYFCQPLFINDTLIESIADHVSNILTEMLEAGVYVDSDDQADRDVVAKNCLKAIISMVVTELTEDDA